MSELDPNLRALLSRSHESLGPPPGVEARMLADFHGRIGGGPAPDPGPSGLELGAPASSSVGTLAYGLKVVGAVLGLTAAGVGGLWLVGQATRPVVDPAPVSAVVLDEGSVEGAEVEDLAVEDSAAERSATEPSATGRSADEPAPTSAPAGSVDALPAVSKVSAASTREDPTSAATLAAELKLIRAARAAPPEQALELLDRHARDFPAGELLSEREALRAVSLCGLGRDADAAQARAKLERLDPGPLLRDKVRKACEAGARAEKF